MHLAHEELTAQIIGAAIEVHKTLGPGFLEAIYENALAIELHRQKVPFSRQYAVRVFYHDSEVGLHRLDLFVADQIVVELKTCRDFSDAHFITVRSYLRAVGRQHGLLLSFAKSTLAIKRVHSGS